MIVNQVTGIIVDTAIHIHTRLEFGFRADLIIENTVLLEVKFVDTVADVYKEQLLTDLRLSNLSVGRLLNVGATLMKPGVVRIANDYDESA